MSSAPAELRLAGGVHVLQDLRPGPGAGHRRRALARTGEAPVAGAGVVCRLEGLAGTLLDLGAGKPVRDRERLVPGCVDNTVAHWPSPGCVALVFWTA